MEDTGILIESTQNTSTQEKQNKKTLNNTFHIYVFAENFSHEGVRLNKNFKIGTVHLIEEIKISNNTEYQHLKITLNNTAKTVNFNRDPDVSAPVFRSQSFAPETFRPPVVLPPLHFASSNLLPEISPPRHFQFSR